MDQSLLDPVRFDLGAITRDLLVMLRDPLAEHTAFGRVRPAARVEQQALAAHRFVGERAVARQEAGKLDRFCDAAHRSEEHTSELQSLMRLSYAVFCLKTKNKIKKHTQDIKKRERDKKNTSEKQKKE